MRIANATNGLAFPPYDAVSMFLSTHGHSRKFGYFRIDAMPYSAVIALLRGETITMVDATQHNKPLTDGFKYGLTTWCMVFNRAIRNFVDCADWITPDIRNVAKQAKHKPLVTRIRRLAIMYGSTKPAIMGDNVRIEVHRNFENDDKPELVLAHSQI